MLHLIREMQMMTDILGTVKMSGVGEDLLVSVGEDVEPLELSSTVAAGGESVHGYKHFGKQLGTTCKVKHGHTWMTHNFNLRYVA